MVFLSLNKPPNVLLFLLFLASLSGKTQTNADLVYRNYSVEDGLPSKEVYQVIQDIHGYMWFATENGLSRFDGTEFANFTEEEGLCDVTHYGFYEDRNNVLWSYSSLGRVSRIEGDSVYCDDFNDSLVSVTQGQIVNRVFIDSQNSLWVSVKGPFFLVCSESNEIELVKWKKERDIIFDIQEIDEEGFVFRAHKPLNPQPGKTFYARVCKYNGDTLFYSSEFLKNDYTNNANCIKRKDGSYVISFFGNLLTMSPQGASNTFKQGYASTMSHYEDNAGNIWVGSYDKGVYYYAGGQMRNVPINYLNGYSVSSIYQDNEGGYWFSTLENGVLYAPSLSILHFPKDRSSRSDRIKVMEVSDNGIVLAGTKSALLHVIDAREKPIQQKTLKIHSREISKIIVDKDEAWIGTIPSMHRYNIKTGTCKLVGKSGGRNLIYNESFGIGKYQGWTERTSFFSIDMNGKKEKEMEVQCIGGRVIYSTSPSENHFYFSTFGNLVYYNKETDSCFDISSENNLQNISSRSFLSVGEDSIWVAAKGMGLLLLKGKEIILQLTKKDGLSTNQTGYLFKGEGKEVWVCTDNLGLNRVCFNRQGEFDHVEVYNREMGLPSNAISSGAYFDSTLYLATDLGIISYQLNHRERNDLPPPIYLKGVKVNRVEYNSDSWDDLAYDENSIQFDFKGVAFKNAGNIQYRYRLLGSDSIWNLTSTPSVLFPALDDGDYTFEVQAANNHGVWSNPSAKFRFSIQPPVWETWWFFTILGTILFISVWLLLRYRFNRMQYLMSLHQQLNSVRSKALSAQLNPHFIFNSLNSVTYYLAENDHRTTLRYLGKFAKLMRLVLDHSKDTMITVEDELDALAIYLELEAIRFNDKLDYTIERAGDGSLEECYMPALLLQPLVENAVWHGIMHKDGRGKIEIKVKVVDESILFTIHDNGIGRERSKSIKEDLQRDHQSSGLSITEDRLKLMESIYNRSYQFEVNDLHDEKGEPNGTLVKIVLPIVSP